MKKIKNATCFSHDKVDKYRYIEIIIQLIWALLK